MSAEPARSHSSWAATCCSERFEPLVPKKTAFLEAKVTFTAVRVLNSAACHKDVWRSGGTACYLLARILVRTAMLS